MSDLLLLGVVALGVLSVIVAVIQLLQMRPPRAGAILLVLAWKIAGWYGLDRWLLPWLGTPWTWEEVREREEASEQEVRQSSPAAD